MKAILFEQGGGPEVLKLADVPAPVPQGSEVLIRLHAAAVNHLDMWVRQGNPAYQVKLPHIPGADGAGVIEAMGPEAEGVSKGDRVLILPALSCGQCPLCKSGRDNQCDTFHIVGARHHGTYAEFITVPDTNVLTIPDKLSYEKAAAFPLTYLTAWHMLVGRAKLQEKETVLVVGASAGVGIAAIQIAKAKKARVLAVTTSESKVAALKSAGANEVFVLKEGEGFFKWATEQTAGRGVDIVFEHVGPATFESSLKSLGKYGRLVTCGATTGPTTNLDLRYIFSRDLSLFGARMGTQKEFQEVAALLFDGKLDPLIDSVIPLEQAADAHTRMTAHQQTGKIVLKI